MSSSIEGKYQPKPFQLVEVNENGKLKLNSDTIQYLRTFPTGCKYFPITIVGSARRGKSTIMNLIAKKYGIDVSDVQKRFAVLHGSDVCTSGVWIYGVPLPHKDGYILLLDCEGTERGSDEITAKLTAFVCFMTSSLILNVDKDFNNTTLAALGVMSSLVNMVDGDFELMFPRLHILLRNIDRPWENALKQKGITAGEMIDAQLSKKNDGYDNTRKAIKDAFVSRQVHLIYTPSDEDLGGLEAKMAPIPDSKFDASSKAFVAQLLKDVQPKTARGLCIGMETFLVMAESYVAALQKGNLSITNVVDMLHCQKAVELADNRFFQNVKSSLLADKSARSNDEIDKDIAFDQAYPNSGAFNLELQQLGSREMVALNQEYRDLHLIDRAQVDGKDVFEGRCKSVATTFQLIESQEQINRANEELKHLTQLVQDGKVELTKAKAKMDEQQKAIDDAIKQQNALQKQLQETKEDVNKAGFRGKSKCLLL